MPHRSSLLRILRPAATALAVAALVVLASAITARVVAAPSGAPLGSAITFQGSLLENGVPVSMPRDFSFALLDAASGGSQVGPTVPRPGLAVSGGTYVAVLDFGLGPWTTGEARWIEVTVNGTPLAPRTAVVAVPQALYAIEAGTAGTATSASQLAGVPAAQFGRLYGDGSAGDLTVPAGTHALADLRPDGNVAFASVVIPAGATLVVPHGTTLRCTGSFTIQAGGTLSVEPVAQQTYQFENLWAGQLVQTVPPPSGIGLHGGPGEPGTAGSTRRGGVGGDAATSPLAVLDPSWGGGSIVPVQSQIPSLPLREGRGGGGILVRCAGPILNQGALQAPGTDGLVGSGGGGGGVVLLGSGTSITSTSGTIDASGGRGSAGTSVNGRGGGGGGGLVRLVAPVIDAPDGQIDVTGGGVGAVATVNGSEGTRAGGGGGGSCGRGGGGDTLNSSNGATAPIVSAGSAGCIIRTIASPQAVWD